MQAHPQHPNLWLVDHPLIHHKLSVLRDRATSSSDFRRLLGEIAGLMTYEVSRRFETEPIEIHTPMERMVARRLKAAPTLVPVLRAGLGMTDGILSLFTEARVGHIGIRRDERTAKPEEYYLRLPPDVEDGPVLVIDPMLATGGSAARAVDEVKRTGARDISVVCLVVVPEGRCTRRTPMSACTRRRSIVA
jgi:uracil phosphoribosyltransferase